jgi:hypothetical protein
MRQTSSVASEDRRARSELHFSSARTATRHEVGVEIHGGDPNRIQHANVREFASRAKHVHTRGTNAQPSRNLADRKQPIAPAVEHPESALSLQPLCSQRRAKSCKPLGRLDPNALATSNDFNGLRTLATLAQSPEPHSEAVGQRFESSVAR